MMKLLTKEIRQKMPRLYDTEEIDGPDKIVQVKYFTPDSNWTWYAVEADAVDDDGEYHPLSYIDEIEDAVPHDVLAIEGVQDVIFFGFVEGFEREWGYFAFSELYSARGPMGLRIERDMYQERKPLREVRADLFGPKEDQTPA